jgi:hypothetical protein
LKIIKNKIKKFNFIKKSYLFDVIYILVKIKQEMNNITTIETTENIIQSKLSKVDMIEKTINEYYNSKKLEINENR